MTNDEQNTTIASSASSAESTPVVVKRPRGRPRKALAGSAPPVSARKRIRPSAPKAPEKPQTEPQSGSVAAVSAPHSPVSPLKYIFAIGRRKRAVARVFFYLDGKGEIEVNGKPIEDYFTAEVLREVVDQPLRFSPVRKSVRIVAQVHGGGIQGQAGAVRLGISRALLKLDENLRPVLRAKGYLTRDPREKERKKPGLKRARRGPQWAKR